MDNNRALELVTTLVNAAQLNAADNKLREEALEIMKACVSIANDQEATPSE